MKIFLRAYLRKNLGDDLFLKIILNRYKRVTFCVNDDKRVLKAFNASNVCGRSTLRRVFDKIRLVFGCNVNNDSDCAATVVLGGSMFIEKSETRGEIHKNILDRYPNDKPLFIIGCNFGPYKNRYYVDEYNMLFSRAEDVCFRDGSSASIFSGLNNVRVAPDLVFGLDISKFDIRTEKKIIISVIDMTKRGDLAKYKREYEVAIANIADSYLRKKYDVVLTSFCKTEGDEEAIASICSIMNGSARIKRYDGDMDDILSEIASSEILIGTRFHSIVLGILFNKRILPIIYSDKTKNMLNDINYKGKMLEINQMADLNISSIDEYIYKYGDISRIREEAKGHFEKLDEFLGKR